MLSVAVIGGGASGVLATLHILKQQKISSRPLQVTIYEKGEQLGAGLAYSTSAPEHILNVPAERMSYDESMPGDFVEWLRVNAPAELTTSEYPFVRRYLFRKYLQDRLNTFSENWRWRHVSVDRLDSEAKGIRVTDASGEERIYDFCVLATGYKSLPMPIDGIAANEPSSKQVENLEDGDLLIVGTGLTAIDHWRTLRNRHFRGRVHFMSRRGVFPLGFAFNSEVSVPLALGPSLTPFALFAHLRAFQKRHHCDWGYIASVVRPQLPSLWESWTLSQRRRCLEHLRPYWDAIRHRMPDVVLRELGNEMVRGDSLLHRSRRASVVRRDGKLFLQTNNESYPLSRTVNATGAPIHMEPLQWSRNLLDRCPLNLGFASRHERLAVLGPASKTVSWESTAIPEIRLQAREIAEKVFKFENKRA